MRIFALLLLLVFALPAYANGIEGLWLASKKRDIAVEVKPCDDGLCGHIVWLNDDKTQNEPQLCGTRVLWGFTPTDKPGHWQDGYVYRANRDETYKAKIDLKDDTHLTLRGYVGLSLFGKDYDFEKVSAEDYPACLIQSQP